MAGAINKIRHAEWVANVYSNRRSRSERCSVGVNCPYSFGDWAHLNSGGDGTWRTGSEGV